MATASTARRSVRLPGAGRARAEATAFQVKDLRAAYVFYQYGLSIDMSYAFDRNGKIFDGMLAFRLSDGMGVPPEFESFNFRRRKSEPAGTFRSFPFAVRKVY